MFNFQLLPFAGLRINTTYVTTNGSLVHCTTHPYENGDGMCTLVIAGEVQIDKTWFDATGKCDDEVDYHTDYDIAGELKITLLSPLELQLAEIKRRAREEVYQELYERSSMITPHGFEFLRDKEAVSALLSKHAEERKTFKQSLENK